ncbi:unnamed protein product [Schistosoma haematobium]|nr:unnamed protein product [Schistosoma haematobium]
MGSQASNKPKQVFLPESFLHLARRGEIHWSNLTIIGTLGWNYNYIDCRLKAWFIKLIVTTIVIGKLSEEFGTDLMKFGKIDVIRYPDVGVKHNIDTSSWSKQLPTLILFRQGHELTRRPAIINTPKKTVQKFTFTWDNMINAFSLNEIYTNQKQTSGAANQCGSAGSTDKDKKNL